MMILSPAIRRAAALLVARCSSSSSLRARAGALPVSRRQGAERRGARSASSQLLAASYDLLLGYTGIVSFAHTMFFGIGSYGVAHRALFAGPELGRARARRSPSALPVSRRPGARRSALFSLRVQAIFFAMITLAVASAFRCWPRSSHGSPAARTAAVQGAGTAAAGLRADSRARLRLAELNGRVLTYYLVFVVARSRCSGAAARRQFAVRPRAAGDPRKRLPRRGARLSHRLSPHLANCIAALVAPAPARSTRCGCVMPGPTPR